MPLPSDEYEIAPFSSTTGPRVERLRRPPQAVLRQIPVQSYRLVRHIALALLLSTVIAFLFDRDLHATLFLAHEQRVTSASLLRARWTSADELFSEVEYHFRLPNGQLQTGGPQTIAGLWYIHDTIRVEYHPTYPRFNRVQGYAQNRYWALLMLVFFAAVLWGGALLEYRNNRRQLLHLVQSGHFAAGILLSRKASRRWHTVLFRYLVSYRLPSGQVVNNSFWSEKKFPTNEALLLLYQPLRPKLFMVIDDLPVAAQRYFKQQAGLDQFTIVLQ